MHLVSSANHGRLKSLLSSSYGIIFLGTPHRGSGPATLGRIAYDITKIMGRKPNTNIMRGLEINSPSLYRTTREFKQLHASRHFHIQSFREEYTTSNVMVSYMIHELRSTHSLTSVDRRLFVIDIRGRRGRDCADPSRSSEHDKICKLRRSRLQERQQSVVTMGPGD